MTFTEAAAHVLRLVGKPLHYKEITDVAIERSLLSHVGKSPEVTMGARLAAQVKKAGSDNPLARVKPGVFALAEWDEKTIKDGLADRTPAIERLRRAEAAELETAANSADEGESTAENDGDEIASSEGEALAAPQEEEVAPGPAPMASHKEIDESEVPPDEVEQRRAELSASATNLFESEDDDDQPIFGSPEQDSSESEKSGDKPEGKRRRRRRRGRGRGDDDVGVEAVEAGGGGSDRGGDDLPTYTVSDADPEDLPASDDVQSSVNVSELDSAEIEVGVSLGDAIENALLKFDRGRGPVSAQNVADALRRRFKGDLVLNVAGILAAVYADNLGAERSLRSARFRIVGNKLALTAWSMDRRTQDRHRALARAAEQVRESTLRSLSEELKRLPQRAVGELVAVLLDRMGVSEMTSIRRPGAHGSELHLSGVVRSGGLDMTTGGALRSNTAIMIRRDGKDIGRERVTEIRGALHHYGPAHQGWLISTGQVLSGAREEAATNGASPVALSGRQELAELCLAFGVGVRSRRLEIPVIDVELFENLQGR